MAPWGLPVYVCVCGGVCEWLREWGKNRTRETGRHKEKLSHPWPPKPLLTACALLFVIVCFSISEKMYARQAAFALRHHFMCALSTGGSSVTLLETWVISHWHKESGDMGEKSDIPCIRLNFEIDAERRKRHKKISGRFPFCPFPRLALLVSVFHYFNILPLWCD